MYFLHPSMYDESTLENLEEGSIFENITFYDQNLHSISGFQLAVAGLDEASLKSFRNHFYKLGDHFQFPIIDLGVINVDSNTAGYISKISTEVPLLLIGGKATDLGDNVALVSKKLMPQEPIKFKHIGYQRHRSQLNQFINMDEYNHVSLGELRKNPMMIEPLLRTCNALQFDLSTIKQSDLGIEADNLVGLTLEESSQICRYAGLTPGMKVIHFPDLQPKFSYGSVDEEFGSAISTMAWYYLEGLLNLKYEQPEEDHHITYVINTEYFEEPITFLKGEKSGRWWMKYGENESFYPCLYEDFIQSRTGNIPDRLYKYCVSA